MENRRLMIFGPHPDDAEIAMGGTIAKLIDQGWEIILADLTNGEPTPYGTAEKRAAEAEKAREILGVSKRICLGLANRYLENNLENRVVIAEAIREYKPLWIFTVAEPDAHPDHVHANDLIMDGRFTAKLSKTEMSGEAHYAKKIIYFYASHLRQHIQPSFVIDITDYWDKKVEAIKAYESQFHLNQNETDEKDWIIDHIGSICRYFGRCIGTKYAEPFFCHELVGLNSLDDLI